MTKNVHYYMSLHYPFTVWQEKDDPGWYARIPLLPHCLADADEWADLPERLREAKEAWLLTALDLGMTIPEPEEVPA